MPNLHLAGTIGFRWRTFQGGRPALLWNLPVAAATALAACLILLGRTVPTQATLGWALAYGLFFCAAVAWLTAFSARLVSPAPRRGGPTGPPLQESTVVPGVLRTLALVEAPLLALALAGSAAIYLSDGVNHQLTYFLQPTPAVVLLLAVAATAVAQEMVLKARHGNAGETGIKASAGSALAACRRWALPLSLLLLGLLQGSSYLWVIGNDFTRYWAVADAIASRAGYPVYLTMPIYVEGGMNWYSVEYPLFPLLLLASFTLLGHDTLGAHLPALLANTALPPLLYALYRKAGLGRPLAFAGACAVPLFPFLRLYTLNAPVPDAVFEALLVGTAYAYLSALSTQHSAPITPLAFSVLAGLTALTRPEGLVFVGVMFLGLGPNPLRPRFYLAVAAFLATVAPFSLVTQSTFGFPWPQNAGSSFGLRNVAENLDWLERMSLQWYAAAFGLPPSVFMALVATLAAAAGVGTLAMARKNASLAVLPLAAGLHVAIVLTIDPRVSGARLWFDFFRHASYGIPFVALALLWGLDREGHETARNPRNRFRDFRAAFARFVLQTPMPALLLLLFSAYELHLLAQPSQTYGGGASQILTSDVWVTFPDVVAHRYPLPQLPFAPVKGALTIDPGFEYMSRHPESVRGFFEPVSAIKTGRGSQYEVSSLLAVLFGAVFALSATWPPPSRPALQTS